MTTNMQSCTPRWPSPWPTVSPAIRCSDTNRWPRGLTRGAPGAASATRRLARPASGSGDAGGAYRRRVLYGLRLGQAPALHDEFQALGSNLHDRGDPGNRTARTSSSLPDFRDPVSSGLALSDQSRTEASYHGGA